MLSELLFWLWEKARRWYVRRRPRTAKEKRRFAIVSIAVGLLVCVVLWVTPLLSLSREIVEKLGIQCDEDRAINFLDQLCSNYTRGYIVGPLCPALCQPSTISDTAHVRRLTIKRCLSHGNKIVLGMTMTRRASLARDMPAQDVSEDVVLKASHFSGEDYRAHLDGPLGGISLSEALELFKDALDRYIKPYRTNSTSLLDFMVSYGLAPESRNLGTPPSAAQLHSLWSLLDQDEFVHLLLLTRAQVTPSLLGSCGHAYVVTSQPPPPSASLVHAPHVSWRERVRTALGFLSLEERLGASPYGILHLCDIQHTNFGVQPSGTCPGEGKSFLDHGRSGFFSVARRNGIEPDEAEQCKNELLVRVIDIDITFFDRRMKEILGQPRCDTDEECQFFDCDAYCDKWRKQCVDVRANSNMQAICQKIFIGVPSITGLLWNSPWRIRRQLQSVLTECADYASVIDKRELAARLRTILLDELKR